MKTLILLLCLILSPILLNAQIGKDGNVTITNTQVVNEYTSLSQDANPGDMVLTVNNSGLNNGGNFSSALQAGDLIMIIQMQGASILGGVNDISWGEILSYNNCGLFEFKEVANVPNATHIELQCPVENTYTQSGHVQVIRVPRYNTLTVDGGTITSLTWNGTIGGVVAIEVNGLTTLINGGTIDVTGQGFRGGQMDNQSSYAALNFAYPNQNAGGEKGESIAGFGPDYSPLGGRYGRGAPANGGGGGNAHNAGGGGGANAGSEIPWNGLGNPDISVPAWINAWNLEGPGFSTNLSSGGGRGGYTFSSSNQNALVMGPSQAGWGGDTRRNTGGIGGRPLDYSSGRLFLGGGGGAGDGNNGAGTNGASGGGLVYLITYNDVVGTGQIIASGQSAPPTPPNGNDAPGGGGGGGTIVVNASGNIATSISLIANGGDGGDQVIPTNEAEGPGGGGGGGYIAFSNGTPGTNVSGGLNGTTNSGGVTEFVPNGATMGGAGSVSFPVIATYNMNIFAVNDTICSGTSTTLNAVAENPLFTNLIEWYDAPFGGNLLSTGSSFTTPALTVNTTYYLKVCPSLSVDSISVIVQPNPVFGIVTDSTNCFGGSDGSASTNGMGSYTYAWSNGQNGPMATGFSAGTYSVTATSSIGCMTTQNFAIEQPSPMNVNFSGTPALCFNDPSGTLTATASGGNAPYNYQWTSPAVNAPTITNVPNGNYTVTITDDHGCIISANGSVSSPLPLTTNLVGVNDVSCFAGSNGNALVAAGGGTFPYSIDWLTLSNDNFFMDSLSAGNYIVEVTDANNCVTSMVVTISEPGPFTVNLSVMQDETCTAGNGIAFASVSGGIGVINYSWTPAVSYSPIANNLSAGPLSVQVQDENGCIATDNVNLINHPTGNAVLASMNAVTCENGSNGDASVNMIGGTAPFNYTWSCSCSNTSFADSLSSGNYSVIVTDNNGCIDTLNFAMTELLPLVLTNAYTSDPLCYGDANGSSLVQANGGTGPYFFSWNTMPAQYSDLATNLSAGNYSVIVTDANNCADTISVSLNQPTELVLSPQVLSNIICFGDSAGVASANATGGTLPYQYTWSNGGNTDTILNLPSGHYTVFVTDANGCDQNGSIEILEYQNVLAELSADTIFCPGDLVTFTVLTNGLNNLYDYNWYVNGNLQSTQNTYTIPIYSTTQISIELANTVNCPDIFDTIVVSPVQLDPAVLNAIGTTDTLCLGQAGIVQAIITDWSYLTSVYWDSLALVGVGPHVVKPTEPGYYVVTIENMCNQTAKDSVFLNVHMPPAADIFAHNTDGCGKVYAEFGYNVAPYDYPVSDFKWSIMFTEYDTLNPVVEFEVSSDVLAQLEIEFSNGCSFDYEDTVHVEVYPLPEANFYYNPDPALQYELTEFIDISHGNPVAWEWYVENQFISTDERTTWVFDETGNYAVMQVITNEYGCSDTAHLLIEVIGDFTVYVPNAFTPDGNDYNNTFQPIMQNVKPDNYEFLIFNRWGELIFEGHNLEAAWDGFYGGDLVPDDVYVWVIRVTDINDKRHEYTGHVALLK
ncbi:MAG: gliding motility-associated C-terminal domain-containing protein [Crocinitomicaceae bacterium]|nr:gliding motility-associated C-terminal domain-containing protein [Crocinitomicaceae bacterium]